MMHQVTGTWRKSSYSANTDSCVEVAFDTSVAIRDTKDRQAGQLTVSATQWAQLTGTIKTAELHDLA